MSRSAYLVLGLCLLAGVVYLFWPAAPSSADPWRNLWQGAAPAEYTVRCNGLEQRIAGTQVTLKGLTLALDRGRADALWSEWNSLRGPGSRFAVSVDEAQLAAYGIDGTRSIEGGAVRLRWGRKDGRGYAWNGASATVLPLEPRQIDGLDRVAGRLDRASPAALPPGTARLEFNGLPLAALGGWWMCPSHPERPPFDRRVQRLGALLERLSISEFTAPAALPGPPLAVVLGPGLDVRIHLAVDGLDGWARIGTWPMQRLDRGTIAAWRSLVEDFAKDYPCNVDRDLANQPAEEAAVRRRGADWFRLDRRDRHGGGDEARPWDLSWSGGREPADPAGADRLAAAMDRLVITAPRLRPATEAPPADATEVTITGQFERGKAQLWFTATEAWTPTHHGRVAALPEELARLAPERYLERRLAYRPAERVAKLQRRFRGAAARDEAFAADERGAWRQTWPSGAPAGDPGPSVLRVARALCQGEARAVRLADDADRAVLSAPEVEIDLRFRAARIERAHKDDADLEDTSAQDQGWCLKREADGTWRAVDKEGAVAWTIADDLAQELLAPIAADTLLPLVPALVASVEGGPAEARWRIARAGEDWTISVRNGEAWGAAQGVDAVQVRRWLRAAAALAATRRDPQRREAAEVPPGTTFAITSMGADGRSDLLELATASPESGVRSPESEALVHVIDDRSRALSKASRAWVSAAALRELLVPAAWFGPR